MLQNRRGREKSRQASQRRAHHCHSLKKSWTERDGACASKQRVLCAVRHPRSPRSTPISESRRDAVSTRSALAALFSHWSVSDGDIWRGLDLISRCKSLMRNVQVAAVHVGPFCGHL